MLYQVALANGTKGPLGIQEKKKSLVVCDALAPPDTRMPIVIDDQQVHFKSRKAIDTIKQKTLKIRRRIPVVSYVEAKPDETPEVYTMNEGDLSFRGQLLALASQCDK